MYNCRQGFSVYAPIPAEEAEQVFGKFHKRPENRLTGNKQGGCGVFANPGGPAGRLRRRLLG
jgi:hypothetical protein